MIRKDLAKTIIADNHNRVLPALWQRSFSVPTQTGKIVSLVGVRRSGKTSHLHRTMQQLIADGVRQDSIIYINCDDERLMLDGSEMDIFLQAYREMYPEQDLSQCYFFFDEIQEINHWEKFINRIYSSISQKIFLTGSNSKLLSREISTTLRGRTISYEIYPLSFSELCAVKGLQQGSYSAGSRAALSHLFRSFTINGGFPETIFNKDDVVTRILQEYFDVMIYRDLIERYTISQTSLVKYLCKRVVAASAGEFSVNKIFNDLKSQGYKVSKDTLYSYMDNIDAIYLSRFINKYSESSVKIENSRKKTYVIDQGLGAALDYRFSQDQGRLLETTVALELYKLGKKLYYHTNGSEYDFIIINNDSTLVALQVCAQLDDESTYRREVRGLVSACKKLHLNSGTILTLDDEQHVDHEGISIDIVPAWQYFTNPQTE